MKKRLMTVFIAALLCSACENNQIEKETTVEIIKATVKADPAFFAWNFWYHP